MIGDWSSATVVINELTHRVEELERQLVERPALPHVVLAPGEVLVLTAPADMEPDQFKRLRADIWAMHLGPLGGRVVLVSDALRAHIERGWRALLVRYMDHVNRSEGTVYLTDFYAGDSPLSDADRAELTALCAELT